MGIQKVIFLFLNKDSKNQHYLITSINLEYNCFKINSWINFVAYLNRNALLESIQLLKQCEWRNLLLKLKDSALLWKTKKAKCLKKWKSRTKLLTQGEFGNFFSLLKNDYTDWKNKKIVSFQTKNTCGILCF